MKNEDDKNMCKIGIVGAGVMGMSIAQTFLNFNYQVVLVDLNKKILSISRDKIQRNIKMQRLFEKSHKNNTQDLESLLVTTTDYEQLANVDFLIESVTEKVCVKESVLKKVDGVCKDDCIFMSNTSCIAISELASSTNRTELFIGVHFMNPVPYIATVEVVKGLLTSSETITNVQELMTSIKKRCVIVNDAPGFVSNRISHLMMNEAATIVQEKIATPQDVDDIFKNCYAHKMGPLETADLIGLDTVVNSLDILYSSYKDDKYKCCELLRIMVASGDLGIKSGKGFYPY